MPWKRGHKLNQYSEIITLGEAVVVPFHSGHLTQDRLLRQVFLVKLMAGATTSDGEVLTVIAEPELEVRPAPELGTPEGDWLCAWCLSLVANERDRFSYEGKDEFTFSNPQGIRFEIITFSQTLGCKEECRRLSTPGFLAMPGRTAYATVAASIWAGILPVSAILPG